MDQQSLGMIQSVGPQLLRTKERNQNEADVQREQQSLKPCEGQNTITIVHCSSRQKYNLSFN